MTALIAKINLKILSTKIFLDAYSISPAN